MEYKECFEIMGKDHSSYSKTDLEAAFMRMKEKGILKRRIRFIQTEGHFADIKENEDFRRFHYRSSGKVYKEFLVYAIERNLNKYHGFSNGELKKYGPKSSENAA